MNYLKTSFPHILLNLMLCFFLLLPVGQANVIYNPPPVDKKKTIKKKKQKIRQTENSLKKKQKRIKKHPLKEAKALYVNDVLMLIALLGGAIAFIVGALLLIFGFGAIGSFITALVLLGLAMLIITIYALIIALSYEEDRKRAFFFLMAFLYMLLGLIFGVIFLVLAFAFTFPFIFALCGFLVLGIPALMFLVSLIGTKLKK